MKNKKGFSLIELIIVVVLIGVLSVVSFVAIQRARTRAMNEKVLDDMMAIYNALEDYQRDHQGKFPIPQPDSNQNILCYFPDVTYAHDCDHVMVAFRQGMIDNNLLTKRYLREVPTDPRTGSRYVYGVTNDGKYFQVAGNYEREDGTYEARTSENIARGFHLPSLIRSFDGANFVIDKETYLPYSPDHLALTARLENVNGMVEVNGDSAVNGQVLRQDDVITTDFSGTADVYFSDGSVTHLAPGEATELELKHMKVDKNDADGTFTKILLRLKAGKIWSKVVRLASESEFRVETNGAIAGVRGTEFGVDAEGNVKVKSGEVWEEGREGGLAEEIPAEEVMAIPEPPPGDDAYDVPEDAQPADYEDFYQVIQLNTGMQPHILSVEAGGKITIRNVNYFVDEVDEAVGLDRSVQVTHLAAYDAESMNPDTGGYDLLIKQTLVPGSNGDPHIFQATAFLGHSVILRFEDRDPNTDEILHHSSFSNPPIQINSETDLNESEIYEEDIVDEVPMLTIMHSPFVPVGETDLLELGTEPPLDGVTYTALDYPESICTVTPAGEGLFEVTGVTVGLCEFFVTATMPDGTTEIPGEMVTIEIIEASANLLLISPFEGEEFFVPNDNPTMMVNFVWDAPNAPADVNFTVNIDNTDNVLGHDFSMEQTLGTGPHYWYVAIVDGLGNPIETSDTKTFTITAVQAGGADFSIHNSDINGNQPDANGNMVTFIDSVYLEVNVAVPDPNYIYQWSGSLPVTNTQGESVTADIHGLAPNTPQPYSIILTVMNVDGNQVDQSSKQLTTTYQPIDVVQFEPQGPLVFMDNNEVLNLRQYLHDEGYYLKGLPHDARFSPTLCTSLTDGSGNDATAVYNPTDGDQLTCLMPIGIYPDMNSAVQYSIDADVTVTIDVEVGAMMDQITAIAFVDQSNNPVTNYPVNTNQSVYLSSPSETPVMITQINGQSATPGHYVNAYCGFTLSVGAGTITGSPGNYTYQAPLSASQDTINCNIAKGTIIVVDGANHEVDPNNDLNVQAMMDVTESLDYICIQNGGYWDGTDCWILGAADESCDTACGGAGLSCAAGGWNSDNTICAELGGTPGAPSPEDIAPYILNGTCGQRDTNTTPDQVCGNSGPIGPFHPERICNCQY